MHKDELIQLHTLFVQIKSHIESTSPQMASHHIPQSLEEYGQEMALHLDYARSMRGSSYTREVGEIEQMAYANLAAAGLKAIPKNGVGSGYHFEWADTNRNEPSLFPEYKSIHISPIHVHRSKAEHKKAIFTLGKEISAYLANGEYSGPARMSQRMNDMLHKMERARLH